MIALSQNVIKDPSDIDKTTKNEIATIFNESFNYRYGKIEYIQKRIHISQLSSHKLSRKSIESYNDKNDENKKIDDFKDILATLNDKQNSLAINVILQCCKNQALKSCNIKVIDIKEMISVNNVDIKHPNKNDPKIHMKIVHVKNDNSKCINCNYITTQKDNLQTHNTTVHAKLTF